MNDQQLHHELAEGLVMKTSMKELLETIDTMLVQNEAQTAFVQRQHDQVDLAKRELFGRLIRESTALQQTEGTIRG